MVKVQPSSLMRETKTLAIGEGVARGVNAKVWLVYYFLL